MEIIIDDFSEEQINLLAWHFKNIVSLLENEILERSKRRR